MLTASLPPELEAALTQLTGPAGDRARASADLSARYREPQRAGPVARTEADVAAYVDTLNRRLALMQVPVSGLNYGK